MVFTKKRKRKKDFSYCSSQSTTPRMPLDDNGRNVETDNNLLYASPLVPCGPQPCVITFYQLPMFPSLPSPASVLHCPSTSPEPPEQYTRVSSKFGYPKLLQVQWDWKKHRFSRSISEEQSLSPEGRNSQGKQMAFYTSLITSQDDS